MTFILDMASGTEYLGEELSSPERHTAQSAQPASVTRIDYPQLQLGLVETGAGEQPSGSLQPGLDLESLIRSLED